MLLILLAVRVLTRTETFQDDLFSNQQTYTFVLWVCCYYTTQKLLKMGRESLGIISMTELESGYLKAWNKVDEGKITKVLTEQSEIR